MSFDIQKAWLSQLEYGDKVIVIDKQHGNKVEQVTNVTKAFIETGRPGPRFHERRYFSRKTGRSIGAGAPERVSTYIISFPEEDAYPVRRGETICP